MPLAGGRAQLVLSTRVCMRAAASSAGSTSAGVLRLVAPRMHLIAMSMRALAVRFACVLLAHEDPAQLRWPVLRLY